MLNNLRDRIMTSIRGNADEHGTLFCLRCHFLAQEITRLVDEADELEKHAAEHAQRHQQEPAAITPGIAIASTSVSANTPTPIRS